VGIVVIPESQSFNHLLAQGGKGEFYAHCMWGAYQGFFDNNIQSDWVHIDDIGGYDFLYLPYPVHMNSDHAKKMTDWVQAGGKLVLEGCPAYFGDQVHVGAEQPGLGFSEACGVVEDEVEFMPDLGNLIHFDWKDCVVDGGLFLQSYTPTTAQAVSHYSDGRIAAVKNSFGKGSILLIGTFPSEGYYRNHSSANRQFFADLLQDAGKPQHVRLFNHEIRTRIWEAADGRKYLWAINATSQPQAAMAILPGPVLHRIGAVLWGDDAPAISDNHLWLEIPAKDVLVVELE
jgi:beta-galactosidase